MAPQLGNYSLISALNRALPVFKRMQTGLPAYSGLLNDGFGAWMDTISRGFNAMLAQSDVGLAIDSGAAIYNTGGGTLTVGGSIANGDNFTLTFVNASFPATVTPGLIIGPVQIVTADTTTVAAKIAALINATQALTNVGINATSAAAVATVKVVGVATTTMTAQLSSGAVITVTVAAPTGGTGVVVSRNVASFGLPTLSSIP